MWKYYPYFCTEKVDNMITTILTIILTFYISVCLIYGVVVLLGAVGKLSAKALLIMIAFLVFPFIKKQDEEYPVARKITKILWCILWLLLVFIIVMEATH